MKTCCHRNCIPYRGVSFRGKRLRTLLSAAGRRKQGKISAQPHTTLCIQFLDYENNYKNNTLPLGKQICFKIVRGCAEISPKALA